MSTPATLETIAASLESIAQQVQALDHKVQALDHKVTMLDQRVEALDQKVTTLEVEQAKTNLIVETYQKSSTQVVNLAFSLLATATITVIVTSVFK